MRVHQVKVKGSEYARLQEGRYLVIEHIADVGDTVVVIRDPYAPKNGPALSITTTVKALKCLAYNGLDTSEDGFIVYSGYEPKNTEIIRRFVSLVPVAKKNSIVDSIFLIQKWRDSVQTMARKLAVRDSDFQKTQVITPIDCHFNGKELDEDEFCVLNEKEQVACLVRLSETVYTKLNNLNKLHQGIIGQVKALEGMGL